MEVILNACYVGNIDQVKSYLQDSTSNPNISNEYGDTPLMYACICAHYEIVQLLLNDPRVGVNLTEEVGQTAFYSACFYNNVDIVKLMLDDNRVDVNKCDNMGITPLIIASMSGHIDCIEWMLVSERFIDIDAKCLQLEGNQQFTALEIVKDSVIQEKNAWEPLESFLKRKSDCSTIVNLLESFQSDPEKAREMLRRKLGILGKIFLLL